MSLAAPSAPRKGRPREATDNLPAARSALRERLGERRGEIEQALFARIEAIADTDDADPTYLRGLHESVRVALDYALEAIETGEERAPEPPPALLAQARMAARHGVGLDIVLRRYLAGYTLLGEFLAREAPEVLAPQARSQLVAGRGAIFDRLIAAVNEEYEREASLRFRSSEERRAERVRRLLAGERLDTSGLAYDFDAHHVAIAAYGPQATEVLRGLANGLQKPALVVRCGEGIAWAWLGARHSDPTYIEHVAQAICGDRPSCVMGLGEPAQGLAGWRLTHRQAQAALAVAREGCLGFARYTEVALLAAALRDDLLATSLRRSYLDPLERGQHSDHSLLETVRAYFQAERNVSSTAAALGVSRNTVASRLRLAEEELGRSLPQCTAELELALRLARLDAHGR